MKCVVADSGPLIALALLDSLQLPKALWGQLLVPATVLQECTLLQGREDARRIAQAVAKGWIEEVSDVVPEADVAVLGLDPGETQALELARCIQAGLLIDERRGRKAASVLKIPHLGTCGLLVKSKQAGLIEQVRPLLDKLLAEGYFLSVALVQDTLRTAQED